MKTTTTKQKQNLNKDLGHGVEKTELCRSYYRERTRINDLQAVLKEGLYAEVDEALVVGELVVFEIGGELKGVKKSPQTKPQVSQALLKEKAVLMRWRLAQAKAERLQKQLDEVNDEIAMIETGCTVPVETGYSVKTIDNPKVD